MVNGNCAVLAIDPGYEQSAFVLFDGRRVLEHGIEPNAVELLRRVRNELGFQWDTGVIEPL